MNVADEIKRRISMPDLLRGYGFEFNRARRIRCPLHQGSDFNCGVKEDFIYCFVCGESADQISLVQSFFGLSFPDAIKKINEDFALGIPIGKPISKREAIEAERRQREERQKRESKKQEKEMLLNEWADAHGRFAAASRAASAEYPQKGEMPSKGFLAALNDLEYARYELQFMEGEIYTYEQINR